MGDPAPRDAVLDALDDLLVVLRQSISRHESATRRARTIRRLRSHGRSYRDILAGVAGAQGLGIPRESVDKLLHAIERLHRAEARTLRDEGAGVEEIAALCGMTGEGVIALLDDPLP
jgi:uncharacterized protein YlxW (UPF0749 family)